MLVTAEPLYTLTNITNANVTMNAKYGFKQLAQLSKEMLELEAEKAFEVAITYSE